MAHYDLLEHKGWTAVSVTIVSPYVEPRFFKEVVERLAPAELTVVIDDGCRSGDVRMIQSIETSAVKVHVALAGAKGLVHMKLFHIEWRTGGNQRAHTLVCGSGNATRQAFEDLNAELMCKVRLTSAYHAPLLAWLAALRNSAEAATEKRRIITPIEFVGLRKGVDLRIPGFSIRSVDAKASSFDMWLQRGKFAAQYHPDQRFMHVMVTLLADLPPGEVEQTFQRSGFETGMTRRLSIPYILLDEPSRKEAGLTTWRSRYFVWTQLGNWCSEECYRAHCPRFRRPGHEGRQASVDALRALGKREAQAGPRREFLSRMTTLWSQLREAAPIYLNGAGGSIDGALYGALFDKRVSYDLELAADKDFVERYVKGYEMLDVPRFRIDAVAWRKFTRSFASELHAQSLKKASRSLPFRRVSDILGEAAFEDGVDLVALLRNKWNVKSRIDGRWTTLGEHLDAYWTED